MHGSGYLIDICENNFPQRKKKNQFLKKNQCDHNFFLIYKVKRTSYFSSYKRNRLKVSRRFALII